MFLFSVVFCCFLPHYHQTLNLCVKHNWKCWVRYTSRMLLRKKIKHKHVSNMFRFECVCVCVVHLVCTSWDCIGFVVIVVQMRSIANLSIILTSNKLVYTSCKYPFLQTSCTLTEWISLLLFLYFTESTAVETRTLFLSIIHIRFFPDVTRYFV